MSKKRFLAIIILSATLAASGATAHVAYEPLDVANRGIPAQGDSEEVAIRRLLEQFRAMIPLSQAVAIAERLHDGSKTADTNFEISDPPIYRVRTSRNERIWENVIDAKTGSVTASEVSSLRELDREDLGNIIALNSVEQELSDAVRIAEETTGGSALAANLMKEDGKLNIVVLIANGDRLKEVVLEPSKVRRGKSAHH